MSEKSIVLSSHRTWSVSWIHKFPHTCPDIKVLELCKLMFNPGSVRQGEQYVPCPPLGYLAATRLSIAPVGACLLEGEGERKWEKSQQHKCQQSYTITLLPRRRITDWGSRLLKNVGIRKPGSSIPNVTFDKWTEPKTGLKLKLGGSRYSGIAPPNC